MDIQIKRSGLRVSNSKVSSSGDINPHNVSILRPVIQVIFSSSFQVEERKEEEDEEEEKIQESGKSKDGKCRKQIEEMCADIKNKLEYSEGGKIINNLLHSAVQYKIRIQWDIKNCGIERQLLDSSYDFK